MGGGAGRGGLGSTTATVRGVSFGLAGSMARGVSSTRRTGGADAGVGAGEITGSGACLTGFSAGAGGGSSAVSIFAATGPGVRMDGSAGSGGGVPSATPPGRADDVSTSVGWVTHR